MKQKVLLQKTYPTLRGAKVAYRRHMRNQMVSSGLQYQSGETFFRKSGFVFTVSNKNKTVKVAVYKKQQQW